MCRSFIKHVIDNERMPQVYCMKVHVVHMGGWYYFWHNKNECLNL